MDGDVKQVGTIDCTPTWESLVDLIIDGLVNNTNPDTRNGLRNELKRMARAADKYNELIKNKKDANS